MREIITVFLVRTIRLLDLYRVRNRLKKFALQLEMRPISIRYMKDGVLYQLPYTIGMMQIDMEAILEEIDALKVVKTIAQLQEHDEDRSDDFSEFLATTGQCFGLSKTIYENGLELFGIGRGTVNDPSS